MDSDQQQIRAALDKLLATAERPRALVVRSERLAAVRQAAERVAAQLLGEEELAFTIVLAGCTGAGKSTLINALAGARIAGTSELRPCTLAPTVYHHRDLAAGGLPAELAARATLVPHDRPELRYKVIVDTPDLDSLVTENRETAKAILKAAQLVVYVLTPERYHEERLWSIIHEEFHHSTALAVLNKADLVSGREAAGILDDVRNKFAQGGHNPVTVLPIWAARHAPGGKTPVEVPPGTPDDYLTLKAYLEHELATSDLVRMVREQRARLGEHLAAEVRTLLPPGHERSLADLESLGNECGVALGGELTEQLDARLTTIEADQGPLGLMKAHQRFWGPFGLWLAGVDFVRFELPRLGQHLRRWIGGDDSTSIRLLVTSGQSPAATDHLRAQLHRLTDFSFRQDLPVQPWDTIAAHPTGDELLADLSRALEQGYESGAAARYQVSPIATFTVSLLGWLLPAGLVIYVLVALVKQFIDLTFTHGLDLLGLLAAVTILWCLVLHGIVDLALVTLASDWSADRAGPVRTLAAETIDEWVSKYLTLVRADIAELETSVREIDEAVKRRGVLGA